MGEHVRGRFKLKRVWSSDLRRASATAEAIGLPVFTSELLRELRFGQWEGRLWPELYKESPQVAAKFVTGDPTFRAPDGESLGELVARAGRFVEESGIKQMDGDSAIVSHGGTLRSLIVSLLGLPADSVAKFHKANAAVSVIVSAPGITRLESLNETAHLSSL